MFVNVFAQVPLATAGILYLELLEDMKGHEEVVIWASSLAANLPSFLGKDTSLGIHIA